jgi:transcriptional regulator GlxA family with amidase domain
MVKAPKPRRVVMLAFEGAQVLDITGPMQMFAAANVGLKRTAYDLVLAAKKAGPFTTTSGRLKLVADASYASAAIFKGIDTLMVSGGDGIDAAITDPAFVKAVRTGAKNARRVSSVCSGALALATAGLLEGKRAATHWGRVEQLARHPNITIESDAIYVRDGRIWTSAGVTAGMDLALAMIREDHGDDLALAIARQHVMFLIRPGGQSQFSSHLAPESDANSRVGSVLRWIPEHISEDLDIEALARAAKMSERTFARAFVAETGETPARYVERARLEAARRLLTGSALSIGVVAVRSGFGSEERMRRAFQRQLKVSPGAFRARFHFQGEQP